MVYTLQPASGHCPVHDFVVDIGGSHIVDVLGIVFAADCFSHADELTWLRDDVSDIAALADSSKFTVVNGCPIHNDRSDGTHSDAGNMIPLKKRL